MTYPKNWDIPLIEVAKLEILAARITEKFDIDVTLNDLMSAIANDEVEFPIVKENLMKWVVERVNNS